MKSTPKKILSLFMSLLMLLSVTSGLTFMSFASQKVQSGDFIYEVPDKTSYMYGYICISKYIGTDEKVTVPAEIAGKFRSYI